MTLKISTKTAFLLARPVFPSRTVGAGRKRAILLWTKPPDFIE